MEEKDIINKAKYDISAFDRLYEKYYLQIYKYVFLRVNDSEIAYEVVSNVFFKAMTKISQFKWRSVPFSSWLYRIAYSEISNYYRREKKQLKLIGKIMIEKEPFTMPEDYDEKVSFDFIHQYIAQLPQRDQDVITLRYFEKKGFDEISQIIGKKEGYVRVILHRALKKLEKLLPKEVLEDVNRRVS